MNPKYPIYIVSKGRWETRYTSKALEVINVPYKIVVEEQEYDQYAAVINKDKILVLDKNYQKEYDACCKLKVSQSRGSGPARNFIWNHSIKAGYKWHWIIDDNITKFYRYNNNMQILINDGTIFRCMEDFINRYKNIAMAGPNYEMFITNRAKYPPFTINTRIYSCNLIRNDIPYRWRGRYNEDTILSLDILKDGWCTVLFNVFLQKKITTQYLKGGNTEMYKECGTLEKSKMLVNQHPDVSSIVYKFNRWHHHVDYRSFRLNKLKLKKGIIVKDGVNNYGMVLKTIGE